ncbi:hypothetical protein ABE494_09165 [Stenotrophomonas lactitubi]|uniref:hypothetical protein n=3 Tax=Stenotrophomonas lactitubi TaxID=2045214 RepID=UPI00320A398B
MKGKVIIGCLLALLAITSIYVVAQSSPGSRKIGSFSCNTCVLGYPQPDSRTKNTLVSIRDSFNLGKTSNQWIAVGDVITVCNGSACVDYQVTVGGDGYLGVKNEPQTTTPPPRTGSGGGGGGGGGGYSGPVSSGSYGSGSGSVTVGGPKPIGRPTHED